MPIRFMGTWDKIASGFTIAIGVVFLVLGAIGLFAGSSANFTLPPVLGGLPFVLGWGMSVVLIRYWRLTNAFRDNTVFVCPNCQSFSDVSGPDDLACRECGLRLKVCEPGE